MHLLKPAALAFGLDQDRRKHQGNAGGRRHHVAKQLERLGRADRGDLAHVPDRGALGVEIGGDHQQPSALGVLAGDLRHDLRPDIACDQLAQPRIAEQPGAEQHAYDAGIVQQAFGDAAGVELSKRVVILRSEERKGRNQAAGAHARDDGEVGRLRAAVQPFSTPTP